MSRTSPCPPTRRARAALLSGLLALCACGDESPPAREGAPPTVPVTVVTLQRQPVELRRELPGRTSAFLLAEVRPQVNGVIEARLFEEGAHVEAGQPLYQLDDRRHRAEHASARAALARARATLESARQIAARTAELAKLDAVSAQDAETSTAALRQAEADVGMAEARLQGTAVSLEFARIEAPIAGRIARSAFTAGALVTANQPAPLTTIQQLDPIFVDLNQSSDELLALRRELGADSLDALEGTPVALLLSDGSVYEHPGSLSFSGVSVDPTTGSVALRVVVPNPERLLLPGMYLRARINYGTRDDGLLVPQRAVTRSPRGEAITLVVDAGGVAERRTLKVGRAIGDRWLVEEGLRAGERVIVEGLQRVRSGDLVEATEAPGEG